MKDFFSDLTPDKILKAAESAVPGGRATGRIFQLNSMENRVYEIEMEEGDPRVAKFYRQGRWNKETILDEHQFLEDLTNAEVPVVSPLKIMNCPDQTLAQNQDGLYYTVFPKVRGRAPDELKPEQAQQLGRLVARMHNIGETKKAEHRLFMTPENFGQKPLDFLIKNNWVAPEVKNRYEDVCKQLIEKSESLFKNIKFQRIHGDCHLGNLLFNGPAAFFLDFDDMVNGPCVQDIWLATPEAEIRLDFIQGYNEMRPFDKSELVLIEPLRALRIINYSAWIAKRWEDPFFKRIFTDFGSYKYWAQEIEGLEAVARLL